MWSYIVNLSEGGFKHQIMAYTENAGLTVNNGERIVLTNLDIGSFQIGSYSVFGMESSTDPPAINSGNLKMEFMSGDPTKNQYALFPSFLVGSPDINSILRLPEFIA